MSNLAKRTITGIIGASLMIGAILWNEYSFAALFLFISFMSLLEFYSLAEKAGIHSQKQLGIAAGIFLYFIIANIFLPGLNFPAGFTKLISYLLIPSLFLIFIFELYKRTLHPFTNISYTLLGIIYFSFTMSLLCAIVARMKFGGFHPGIMAGYMFILWASDIGAYFAGRKFGKRKLFERISPKKTWEGTIGGAVFAFIIANVVMRYETNLTFLDWHVITAIIIVFGTLGDLVESMFKRSIEIKDSGTILPGHGGFLDRFDGLFISSPFVFTYLFIVYS